MSSWAIELTTEFEQALKSLDKPMRQRVAAALDDISQLEDPRSRGRGLTGNLTGYWRYRIGDYRMLVDIQDHQLTMVALMIGHRSRIYGD